MDYIEICEWDRFQHYKKRNPPWVKLYSKLLDDDEFDEELKNDETIPEQKRNAKIWYVVVTESARFEKDWNFIKDVAVILKEKYDGVIEDPTTGEFIDDIEEL